MLITSQRELEFGSGDQPEMEQRLRTYTFWTRTNPTDCVLRAAQNAEEAENEDESKDDSDENAQEEKSTLAEGVLREEEKAVFLFVRSITTQQLNKYTTDQ